MSTSEAVQGGPSHGGGNGSTQALVPSLVQHPEDHRVPSQPWASVLPSALGSQNLDSVHWRDLWVSNPGPRVPDTHSFAFSAPTTSLLLNPLLKSGHSSSTPYPYPSLDASISSLRVTLVKREVIPTSHPKALGRNGSAAAQSLSEPQPLSVSLESDSPGLRSFRSQPHQLLAV